MSVLQMLTHVDGAFRMAVGELYVDSVRLPMTKMARWYILCSGIPWPRNYPTVAELDKAGSPNGPVNFDQCRTGLIERVRRFGLPFVTLMPEHPMLGPMTRWEWMRWGFLHIDHHLRQFGL